MEPLITTIFKELSSKFSGSVTLLKPVAYQMLGWFFMYELCSSLLLAKAGTNPLTVLKDKIKVWAFLYIIIYYFHSFIDLFNGMFQHFLETAIGKTPVPVEEIPYDTLTFSYEALGNMAEKVSLYRPSTWLILIGVVIGLFIFARISLTIGMVIIEYMAITSLVIVLVPFMMFEKLRFVGEKVVGTIINLNMKLFVIQYLMCFFMDFLEEGVFTNNIGSIEKETEALFYWLAAMGMLALVTLRGNELAQTLVSGVTSFGDSAGLMSAPGKAFGAAKSSVAGAVTAGKTIAGAAKGGINGAKSGFESGKSGIGKVTKAFIQGSLGSVKEGYKAQRRHTKGKNFD